jgi:hypothetical protein
MACTGGHRFMARKATKMPMGHDLVLRIDSGNLRSRFFARTLYRSQCRLRFGKLDGNFAFNLDTSLDLLYRFGNPDNVSWV